MPRTAFSTDFRFIRFPVPIEKKERSVGVRHIYYRRYSSFLCVCIADIYICMYDMHTPCRLSSCIGIVFFPSIFIFFFPLFAMRAPKDEQTAAIDCCLSVC